MCKLKEISPVRMNRPSFLEVGPKFHKKYIIVQNAAIKYYFKKDIIHEVRGQIAQPVRSLNWCVFPSDSFLKIFLSVGYTLPPSLPRVGARSDWSAPGRWCDAVYLPKSRRRRAGPPPPPPHPHTHPPTPTLPLKHRTSDFFFLFFLCFLRFFFFSFFSVSPCLFT